MAPNEMPSHHGPAEPHASQPESAESSNPTVRLLRERGSVRHFSPRPIPADVLRAVLEAGIHAPTGGNLQPYSIIQIEAAETRRRLAKMCGQAFIAAAPVDLLFCIDWHRSERWARLECAPYTAPDAFRHFWISMQDTVICAQNLCTAADALGLGSVYSGTIMELQPETRELLELPRHVLPVVLLCLGYPETRPAPRRKLGVETIVHRERYQEPSDDALLQAFEEKYPGQRVEITPDRLDRIRSVCTAVGGEELASACLQRIREQGYIRPVQRYFGLHYLADLMPDSNERFMNEIEACGFGWFRRQKFEQD